MSTPLETWLAAAHNIVSQNLEANGVGEKKPIQPGQIAEFVDTTIGVDGTSQTELLATLTSLVAHTPKTYGPRFFNQLFGGVEGPALCGEILASFMNTSMYTYKVAGPQVSIEREVISRFMAKAGFESGEGEIVPGGSIANLLSMYFAREKYLKDNDLSHEKLAKLTAYTSEDSHYSIQKNGNLTGVTSDRIRKIRCDEFGRMDTSALEQSIAQDRNTGYLPFWINATAGTTVLGAFDPIPAICEIGHLNGLWVHVDAAWGGGVLLSARHAHLMDGASQADSLSWCAHKAMGVPLSASVLMCKTPGCFSEYLSPENNDGSYLFQQDHEVWNPGTRSLQCGRRNDALKIWAAWKYYGDKGYEDRVNRQFELAEYAERYVAEHPNLNLVVPRSYLNICFTVKGVRPEIVCGELYQKGQIQVGHGHFRGHEFVRLVTVNPNIRESDLDYFFESTLQI